MAKLAKKAIKKAAKKAAKQTQKQLVMAVLERAKELLSKPKAWTKGVAARNKEGVAVSSVGKAACQFCAYGAITRSVFDLTGEVNSDSEDIARYALGFDVWDDLFEFNDKAKTKKVVLGLFGTAIQRLEAQA
jgi:uncharacterized membrane protein